MTLDEAIKHAEKVAKRERENAQVYDKVKNNNLHHPDKITCEQAAERCRECAEEQRQLAEWLKELKQLREQTRWIPANQPPKASGRYIVTRHFFDNDFVEIVNYSTDLHTVDKYDFPKHKAGWYNDDCEYGDYELDDIVAWMPRPEPYKASQMGKKAKR